MNIYDIAKEAGVSISTVSRVMNNHPNVSDEKRKKVLMAFKKHNYIPSAIARSLANRKTKTIGIMTVDVRHLHYASISYIIESTMKKNGYNVILCNTGNDLKEQVNYLKVLAEKQVDGIILIGSIFSNELVKDTINNLMSETPIVTLNSQLTGDNIYNVNSNDDVGIGLSVDYLIKKGYKNIVFVKDNDTLVGEAKVKKYIKKMAEYNIEITPNHIIEVESGIDGGIEAVRKINDSLKDYSAIIGCEDLTAVGIIKELKNINKRIPEDVGVIGFNNSIFSIVSEPTITSIDNKMEEIGQVLANTLIDIFIGEKTSHEKNIYPELIKRQSI